MSPPHRRDVLVASTAAAAVTLLPFPPLSSPLAAGATGGTVRIVIDGAASGLDELYRSTIVVPGVQSASCWIEGNALVACSEQVAPVRIRGWRRDAVAELTTIMAPLISGSTHDLDKEGHALIGDRLASRLRTSVGETIQIFTPTAPMPTHVSATITGVFRFGAERADEVLLYVAAATARKLLPGSLAQTIVQAFVAPSAGVDAVRDRLARVMPRGAALSIEEG